MKPVLEPYRDLFGWWAAAQRRFLAQVWAGETAASPLLGWAQPALRFHIRQQRAWLAGWQHALDAADDLAAGLSGDSESDDSHPAKHDAATPAAPRRVRRAPQRDDLKQVAGIGPVLEKKLNAEGIVNLKQLAALTPADIARLEETVIRFPGRIERENWVGQARKLAAT